MGAYVRAKGVEWGMGICPHALLMRHSMHVRLQACRCIGTRRLPVCLHRQHCQDVGHRQSHDGLSEEPDEAPLQEAGGSCISKGWCMLHMCSCTAGSPLRPRPCNALPCPVDNPLLAFQYAVLGMGMEDER